MNVELDEIRSRLMRTEAMYLVCQAQLRVTQEILAVAGPLTVRGVPQQVFYRARVSHEAEELLRLMADYYPNDMAKIRETVLALVNRKPPEPPPTGSDA